MYQKWVAKVQLPNLYTVDKCLEKEVGFDSSEW